MYSMSWYNRTHCADTRSPVMSAPSFSGRGGGGGCVCARIGQGANTLSAFGRFNQPRGGGGGGG